MFESFFIFDGKFYEQFDGVAMGSPLGPTLANVFMCHFENIWLENCPAHFKPIVYWRFVDDTFLLFRTKDHVEKFKNYLNKQHKNIKFTSQIEENGSLSFLDITITCENYKFLTSVYHKPKLSGVFTNFESFIPDMHKCGLIETLLHRSFRLCSSYENFHREIETLMSIFKYHLLQCTCAINFDDFSILATDWNKFKLLLRESLLIKRDKPILNRMIKSFPLELFD